MYLPAGGRLLGFGSMARMVEIFSRRLQIQERLTDQIADTLEEQVSPEGVLVVLDAEQLCMTMRGVKSPGSRTLTMAYRGAFDDPLRRQEALILMGFRA
jgi:GTP cyclohydrolase I